MISEIEKNKTEIINQLYHLWNKSIGTKDFDRMEWIELEKKIIQLSEMVKIVRKTI